MIKSSYFFMRAPFFSIITITKNNVTGLKKTYSSLINQTEYEWIVIDGASTDTTTDFLTKTNATWFSAPDNGIYDAMNKGIARANGIYIIFMNAGDQFASSIILKNIQEILQKDSPLNLPDFIYGDALEEKNITNKNIFYYKKSKLSASILNGLFTHHQAMFYKRAALKTLKYNTFYKYAADYDFTLQFLKNSTAHLYISMPFCIFEAGGISQKYAGASRKEEFIIRQKYGYNILKNIIIYIRQSITYGLRIIFPKLFWLLRGTVQPYDNIATATAQNQAPLPRLKNQA